MKLLKSKINLINLVDNLMEFLILIYTDICMYTDNPISHGVGLMAQHFFDGQNLTKTFPGKIRKKYLFVHDDLRNTFYFRQFLIL